MPVIGLNFTSINARIDEKKLGADVDVNSTPEIKNIAKKDIRLAGVKDVLSIEFDFATKYTPDIGEIQITGEVLYQTDEAEKILEMWEGKQLEAKMTIDVLNAVFRKCITKAVQIADDLRLPPPLTFPTVKSEKMPEKQAGRHEKGKKAAAS